MVVSCCLHKIPDGVAGGEQFSVNVPSFETDDNFHNGILGEYTVLSRTVVSQEVSTTSSPRAGGPMRICGPCWVPQFEPMGPTTGTSTPFQKNIHRVFMLMALVLPAIFVLGYVNELSIETGMVVVLLWLVDLNILMLWKTCTLGAVKVLRAGDKVTVLRIAHSDGHTRARIGNSLHDTTSSQWISIQTALGRKVLVPGKGTLGAKTAKCGRRLAWILTGILLYGIYLRYDAMMDADEDADNFNHSPGDGELQNHTLLVILLRAVFRVNHDTMLRRSSFGWLSVRLLHLRQRVQRRRRSVLRHRP